MADSTITLVGNATRDPELKYTPTGRPTCGLGLAVSRRWQKDGQWQEQTSFFNVVAWGTLAENTAASVLKGARLVVTGSLQQRSWETQEGEKRSIVEVNADEIGPSMKWATVQVARTEREKPAQRQNAPQPVYGDEEEPF